MNDQAVALLRHYADAIEAQSKYVWSVSVSREFAEVPADGSIGLVATKTIHLAITISDDESQ